MASVSGSLTGLADVSLEVFKRAFLIVTGYFIAKFSLGMIGKAVPMVGGYGNYGILALGLVGAYFTSGIMQDLFVGAAILGAVNVVDAFVTPAYNQVAGMVAG
uniref:Uncharacterized protein n=1 Tax=viral metagenome TaxID=1070528 RepID=A0A6M3IGF5_9ZZZZ